jgi:hypothetical protein
VEGAPEQPDVSLELVVPPEEEAGRYSNLLSVWHTQHEFTLDFAVLPQPTVVEEGTTEVQVQAQVVARLKIPPTLLFSILQTLNTNLSRYEENFGEVRKTDGEEE